METDLREHLLDRCTDLLRLARNLRDELLQLRDFFNGRGVHFEALVDGRVLRDHDLGFGCGLLGDQRHDHADEVVVLGQQRAVNRLELDAEHPERDELGDLICNLLLLLQLLSDFALVLLQRRIFLFVRAHVLCEVEVHELEKRIILPDIVAKRLAGLRAACTRSKPNTTSRAREGCYRFETILHLFLEILNQVCLLFDALEELLFAEKQAAEHARFHLRPIQQQSEPAHNE
eukprot:2877591-Rhodomonas_salina.1